jgi:hypothetical protein
MFMPMVAMETPSPDLLGLIPPVVEVGAVPS